MNAFTKFLQQLQSLFAGMTPQARMLSILLGIAIAVSSGLLLSGNSAGASKTVYLFDGQSFNESQMAKFDVAFSAAGLKDWENVGSRIKIPESKKGDYYKAISDGKAMPDTLYGPIDAAMKENNILEPTAVTKARQQTARDKSLANSLKSMPFIKDAFVTFDSDREGFASQRKKTASIAIMPQGGVPLTRTQALSIMNYVQKSVAGLKSSDIALLDLASSRTIIGEDDPEALEQERYYQVKKQQEDDFRKRAKELLADYGDVRLDVNVEIDPVLSQETNRLNYDAKPTTVQSTTTKKDSDSMKAANGGRPGTDPNAISSTPNRGATISPEQTSKSKELTESNRQVVGNTLTSTKTAGLQIKRVSFSVAIPFSYYKKVYQIEWQEQNPKEPIANMPPLTETALTTLETKINTRVKNMLTAIINTSTPGEDKYPNVTVDRYIDFPVPELPGPSLVTTALAWLSESWQTLALAFVALAAVISMRGFVKNAPAPDDSAFERGFDLPLDDASELDLSGIADDEPNVHEEEGADGSPPKLKTTGGDIKSNLTTMVRENPDAAATLLRNWIAGTKG